MLFKKIFLIPLVCLFITSPFLAFASGSKTITRGDAVTIDWNVTGAPSCTPDTSYPVTAGDNVVSDWKSIGNTSAGSVTFNSVYQNQPTPSGYSFSCENTDIGIMDQITLYVNDCPTNAPWDEGTHACVNPIPTVSISPSNAQTIVLGASVAYASTVTDTGAGKYDPSALRASPLLHRGDKV